MADEPTIADVLAKLDQMHDAQTALHASHMELYGIVRKVARDQARTANRQEVIIDALGALRADFLREIGRRGDAA